MTIGRLLVRCSWCVFLIHGTVSAQDSSATGRQSIVVLSDSSSRDWRLAVFTAPAKRIVSTSGAAYGSSEPQFTSLELVLRAGDGGLRARYETAAASGAGREGNKETYLDGRFSFGGQRFNVELGYVLRTESFDKTDSTVGLARGGFRGDYHVESSGVLVGWAASYMRQIQVGDGQAGADGFEGETSALYVPPRYPVFVQLGYSREILRFTTDAGVRVRNEELSILFLGIGLQLGLR